MKAKLFLSLILLFFIVNHCFSQIYRGQEASSQINNTDLIKFKNHTKVPNYLRFSENATRSEQEAIEIVKSFITNSNSDLQLKNVQNNGNGTQTHRYYQTVSGFPIEFTALNLQVNNDRVTEINGDILDHPEVNLNFLISEAEALQSALNFVNAKQYMWEENDAYFPIGEKVIVPDQINLEKSILKAAYKFEIYSKNPFNRQMIYVDAETGKIILDLPLIHFNNVGEKSITGTAQTAYYGEQQIAMSYNGSQYTLNDPTRGGGIRTYNCNNTANYYTATDFFNNSTDWGSNAEYGTDAHFSTVAAYDYFFEKHGFNSINNAGFPLRSYVHFNLIEYGFPNNVNAFWNGQAMTYGDGNSAQGITPLTVIDICGHEITHGLVQFTAGLIYSQESGALNEAFADIFGTALEHYAVPEYANWLMGDAMGLTIRNTANPNALGAPRNYKGNFWDFATQQVHHNSNPFSHWFYLLSEGGNGTNDFGNSFNVNAIGMGKAEQIAFVLLTQYLLNSSGYEDACFLGLQVAEHLFGGCSEEVKAVADAFYAIGVLNQPYDNHAVAEFKASITETCIPAPITVQFLNQSYNSNLYLWDFGDGSPTSTEKNPIHTYAANGQYTVTLTASGEGCGTNTKIKQDYIHISPDLPCNFYMTEGVQNIEVCSGIIYDDGGPDANYSLGLNSRLTLHSPGTTVFTLNFIEFNIGHNTPCNVDYLAIYRGTTVTPSALVGRYCNTSPPNSTMSVEGEYVTLHFSTRGVVSLSGFKIEFSCSEVGVQENTLQHVTISPNPSNGIFRIENLQNIENHTITISEISGKILNTTHLINGNTIDLSGFANGIYFIKIDRRVFKVVKN
ncbi:MAG: M4 family metallopeptidase [Bacteroidetes bacterium]|nr:M4 family metallopeptidase [Bacteroidota bacterium]MCL2302380.1 M4 family metallopeptidase [Lentimicrobiaceae bacterium]